MGSWAGAKYSDGTREWDLFSNIQILFDQHIQRIGWQRCLGKAYRVGYNLQDLTLFHCKSPFISLKPDAL